MVDLDNTLYHAEAGLFARMDANINRFIRDRLGVPWETADAMRLRYWRRYGTTLTGLMRHHAVEPEPFLHAAHDLELDDVVEAAPELEAALARLPMRKVIHSNATREHVERILERLGVRRHFQAIYDIRFHRYRPKPCRETLALLLQREGCPPPAALVIDDSADNLLAARAIGCATGWITRARRHGGFDLQAAEITTLLRAIPVQETGLWRDQSPVRPPGRTETAQGEHTP